MKAGELRFRAMLRSSRLTKDGKMALWKGQGGVYQLIARVDPHDNITNLKREDQGGGRGDGFY